LDAGGCGHIAGTYTLKATADPMNRVVEGDETNNIAQVSITVEAKAKPFPWGWVALFLVIAAAILLYFIWKRRA